MEERDRSVLRDLARHAAGAGVEFFVIGAGARLLVHDWPRQLAGARSTTDWDVAVRVESWRAFDRLKQALTAVGMPFSATSGEHRVRHVQGRHLDIVPFGGVESPDRSVTYPRAGTTLSTLGLAECVACCSGVDVGEGTVVQVVGAPGFLVLKASTYLGRRADTRRDVEDFNFVVETYTAGVNMEQEFERAGDALRDGSVLYEDVGAYLAGRDVSDLTLPEQVMRPLHRLVEELVDPSSRAVSDLVRHPIVDPTLQRAAIQRRYAAFHRGLSG
jgi:predicted nucleotidyltransferase